MFVILLDSRVGDNFSQAKGQRIEVGEDEGRRMIAAGLAKLDELDQAAPQLSTAHLAGPDGSGPIDNATDVKAVEAAIDGPREVATTNNRPRRGGRKPKGTGGDVH